MAVTPLVHAGGMRVCSPRSRPATGKIAVLPYVAVDMGGPVEPGTHAGRVVRSMLALPHAGAPALTREVARRIQREECTNDACVRTDDHHRRRCR
jgi:hypothetical protein